MNVLLVGHACGPEMGSEPGGTWNWAQSLSHQHQVWVITHPQFKAKVNQWMSAHPNERITFIWVDVKSALDPWNPAKGESGIRLHYMMWLKEAYSTANSLCGKIPFDVVHHVSWGTMRAAPPLWQLSVPAVWGPLGGGQCAPWAFLEYFGWRFWQEIVRHVSSWALYFSPGLRKAANSAAVVFATNRETETVLRRLAGSRVRLLLDCALPADWVSDMPPKDRDSQIFTLLWVGRLEHRKALALALHALAKVQSNPIRLMIAGSGPLLGELEALTTKLGLVDRVTFLGSVPYQSMQALFQSSDALLFTSLRDSFGSVVLEAMSQGVPVITLNHQGVGTFVPDQAGIKVPVETRRATIQYLADAIDKVSESRTLHRSMQLAAWNFAQRQTWERKAEEMSKVYEEVAVPRTSSTRSRNLEVPTVAEIES